MAALQVVTGLGGTKVRSMPKGGMSAGSYPKAYIGHRAEYQLSG